MGCAAQMDDNEVLLQGLANLLCPQSNAQVPGSISGFWSGQAVAGAVARTGNWVGGRFVLTPAQLFFHTNALNRGFQIDSAAVVLDLTNVRRIDTGRMFRFLKTLDITTDDGVFRLRTGMRKRRALEAELRRLCPELGPT